MVGAGESLESRGSASVVIGAPKANTKQAQVTEGGSVFYCPWSLSQADCHTIDFDTKDEQDKGVLKRLLKDTLSFT
ncbi:Integrin alpha-8 [Liparis tanakae]|uniref:Integrin alpha-8 n=1 Tax=Liparis tanakae TaxID=230148 RepID=A0A4Z2GV12_9TELE|nr:Integrin alpha-8 [Liparis tanakae]